METSVSNLYSVDRIYVHLPILGSLLTDFLNRSKTRGNSSNVGTNYYSIHSLIFLVNKRFKKVRKVQNASDARASMELVCLVDLKECQGKMSFRSPVFLQNVVIIMSFIYLHIVRLKLKNTKQS